MNNQFYSKKKKNSFIFTVMYLPTENPCSPQIESLLRVNIHLLFDNISLGSKICVQDKDLFLFCLRLNFI